MSRGLGDVYKRQIVTRVYRLPPDDAEDVFQEVFARVFERLDTLRDGDALRPWIAQLARSSSSCSIRSQSVASSRRAVGSCYAASTHPVGGAGSARSSSARRSSGVTVSSTYPPDAVEAGFLPGSSASRSRPRHRAIRLAIVPEGRSSSAPIVR